MTVTLKKIKTEKEINELFQLVKIIWPEVFTSIIGKEQVDYMLKHYQSVEGIKQEIEQGVAYFLVQLQGKSIGYVAYEVQEDKLFISKLYLLASQRGKGLSRELFDWLEEIARVAKKEKFHLHVNRYNEKAIAVYQHLGFEIVEQVDSVLGEEFLLEDYYMEKTL
ncbi:MAG: GNAT family N-acetyltransferase [Lactobacillales bacterium]|jgi:ribosomal protein S18 acetylase RimI-like enzyme|nr:GNAT family N-acetyltransferase [Lactobacillales bacterium]